MPPLTVRSGHVDDSRHCRRHRDHDRDRNRSHRDKDRPGQRDSRGEEKPRLPPRSRSRSASPRGHDDGDARIRRRREGGGRGRGGRGRGGGGDRFEWGRADQREDADEQKPPPQPKQQATMSLSGKLVQDTNMYKGVLIKYSEPANARLPKRRWRLYPFKGEEAMKPLYVHRQSGYLMGRDRKIADIPLDHPSISKQHAALQYRLVEVEQPDGSKLRHIKPYIIDLESANGTFLNGNRIEARRYVELKERDVLKFGYSSREYVVLSETTAAEEPDDEGDGGGGGGGSGGGGGGGGGASGDQVSPSHNGSESEDGGGVVGGAQRSGRVSSDP